MKPILLRLRSSHEFDDTWSTLTVFEITLDDTGAAQIRNVKTEGRAESDTSTTTTVGKIDSARYDLELAVEVAP